MKLNLCLNNFIYNHFKFYKIFYLIFYKIL
uniref:Uncharacterized protein n=1 Tax=viral metagenome TaxID=1070528 RepID=A0A6C0KPE4_9ZZZZ